MCRRGWGGDSGPPIPPLDPRMLAIILLTSYIVHVVNRNVGCIFQFDSPKFAQFIHVEDVSFVNILFFFQV